MKAERVVAIVTLGTLLMAAGCKKSQAPSPGAPLHYASIDYRDGGSVEGTIHFVGKAPKPRKIDMSKYPACAGGPPSYTQGYVVSHGGLANVFVYVSRGLENRVYKAPSKPVIIDERDCRFVPHVAGVMTGQPVEWVNDDAVVHDVHVAPSVAGNQPVDFSLLPGSGAMQHTFAKPELMMSMRSGDQPWMHGFINVVSNPFYAISGDSGQYIIHGLPPGAYTLVAYQENLGMKTADITIGPDHTVTQDFTFTPGSGSAQ